MREFIRRRNIENYRKLLAATTDDAEREVLLKLLAEEEAKGQSPKPAQRDAAE